MVIGCPAILRCDKGTENSILAACHMTMRHTHTDSVSGEKSFRYGPSTSNTVNVSFLCTTCMLLAAHRKLLGPVKKILVRLVD